MRESETYQMILNKGLSAGLLTEGRRLLLRRGIKRLGAADPTVVAAIEGIHETEIVEALIDQLVDTDVQTWNELLNR